jgi:hypothetical protein
VEFEKAKQRLKAMDRIHLEDRARQMMEVYEPPIGGMEFGLGRRRGLTKVETKEELEAFSLEMSTDYLWSQATECYVYGNFQACIILLATMLEAALDLKLRVAGLSKEFEKTHPRPEDRTLGRLLRFCESKKILRSEIIKDGWSVNNLRIDAVHLKSSRKMAQGTFVTDLDEIQFFNNVEELKGRPVEVNEKEGWITGDNVAFGIDVQRHRYYIVYKFKAGAKEALERTRNVIQAIQETI